MSAKTSRPGPKRKSGRPVNRKSAARSWWWAGLAVAAALGLEQQSRQGRIYLPGSWPTDLALGEAAPLARHPFFRRLVGESLEQALEEITRSRKVITVS